jgi:Sensors of blue-light using FAD
MTPRPASVPAAPPLERLVYVSRAAPGLVTEDVYAIIRTAHARNAVAGISGALVFLDGYFAQLIEGPPPSLSALAARLRADPRHAAIDLRVRERALCRLFRGQAMALRTRACFDEGFLAAAGYRARFPAEALPADLLIEFLVRACRSAFLNTRGRPHLARGDAPLAPARNALHPVRNAQ